MDDSANLVNLYLAQILNGCNNINCTNPNCHSCSAFQFKFDSIEKAEEIAKSLAKSHAKKNKLCSTLSPLLLNPHILMDIVHFNSFSKKVIFHQDISADLKYLEAALNDVNVFCHLFLGNDENINKNDLNFNIEACNDFCKACTTNSDVLKQFSQNFSQLLTSILAQPNNCLHVLRGIFILFLYPT